MNLKRLQGALALSLAGSLALAACGDDGDPNPTPDMGVDTDTGVGPGDTGMTTPDTGMTTPDMGTTPDIGTNPGDGGTSTPDMGPVNLPGEGEACATTGTSCADGLACVNFGEAAQVCLNVCQTTADCTGSLLVPPAQTCANEGRLTAQDGTQFGWCVQEVVSEGMTVTDPPDPTSTASVKLRACDSMTTTAVAINDTEQKCVLSCMTNTDCAGSVTMPPSTICSSNLCVQALRGEGSLATVSATITEGCAEGLRAFGPDANQPGKLECAKECATNADCTAPGLGTCNVNQGFFTGMNAPTGVCSRGEGGSGSPCNDRHIASRCTLDFAGQGLVLCTDFFGSLNNDEVFDGVCTNFCGDLDGDPMTPASACIAPLARPGLTPSCVQTTTDGMPLLGNPDIGVCSDGCDNSPNDCGGTNPTQCFELQALFNFPVNFSQCVEQATPLIPAWFPAQGQPTAEQQCADRWHRCPSDSFCVGVANNVSACVIGCDATAPAGQTGCEGKSIGTNTNLTCTALQAGMADGICEPATM